MQNKANSSTQTLFERGLITYEQLNEIESYRNLKIFSLRTELQLLLYLSVLLFTSGIGILIYQHIDTIGHVVILALILVAIVLCFYLCIKNSTGYRNEETAFANPVFNYVLLAANILTCIFVGYLQFQYTIFGTHYGLVTLLPTIIALLSAYYFDNRSVLSIGLTGLAAYIGLSVSPQSILSGDFIGGNLWLSLSAFGLGVAFLVWADYARKRNIKTHFEFLYSTFALHLVALSLLKNCFDPYWPVVILLLVVSTFYFHRLSVRIPAVSIFVFNLFYAYIGFNFFLAKLFTLLGFDRFIFDIWQLLVVLLPAYVIASIVLFIKALRNFNKNKANENI